MVRSQRPAFDFYVMVVTSDAVVHYYRLDVVAGGECRLGKVGVVMVWLASVVYLCPAPLPPPLLHPALDQPPRTHTPHSTLRVPLFVCFLRVYACGSLDHHSPTPSHYFSCKSVSCLSPLTPFSLVLAACPPRSLWSGTASLRPSAARSFPEGWCCCIL